MGKKKRIGLCISIIIILSVIVATGIVANANTSVDYKEAGEYTAKIMKVDSYHIFYPEEIADIDGKLPLILWGNGTAMTPTAYKTILSHITTHGFVIIAPNSGFVGSGKAMLDGIDYMKKKSEDVNGVFYNKIDFDNIGAAGHSQGGKGAINCANDSRVKCTIPIQAPQGDDISKAQCPMFLIGGTNDFIVRPSLFIIPTYNASKVPTIYGCIKNASHTISMFYPEKIRGYVTAWFYGYLKGDEKAMEYFTGDNYTLKNDSEWTDVRRKNF